VLWRDGLDRTRREAARRRLEGLGTVRIVFADGVLATVDHDRHPLVRSWPEVRVVGGVSLQRRRIDGRDPSRTIPSTVRAKR
jgi:hypothetical protein